MFDKSRTTISKFLQTHQQVDLGRSDDTILVAGSGRSGTTWLGNVIAAATHSRTIFEPFLHDEHRRFVSTSHRAEHQINRQIYFASAAEPQLEQQTAIADILAGRLRTAWTEKHSRPGIYHRRVIKAIRANLMLGWLARQYPNLKIIWIVRDPVAVIQSQLLKIQQGWQFGWQPEFVLTQPELMNRHLQPFRQRIAAAESLVERLACKWCIETLVPLQECANCKNVLHIDYEAACAVCQNGDPLRQLEQFLHLPNWSAARAQSAAQQRSFTSHHHKQAAAATHSVQLQSADIRLIEAVVQDFSLQQYLPLQSEQPSGAVA